MSFPESSPRSQLSFETMLGWFGRFTPQFKITLMALARNLPPAEFDSRMREIIGLYRVYVAALASVAPGAHRAAQAHALMEEESANVDLSKVQCARGCSACCRVFPRQITSDEAARLAEAVVSGAIGLDRERLRQQSEALAKPGADAAKVSLNQPCVFLGEESECRAYAVRPGVCRKYHVTSAPAECEKTDGRVVPQIDLVPEMIVSALMSLPDVKVGWMPALVQDAIEAVESDRKEANQNLIPT